MFKTLHTQQYISVFDYFFFVNMKKEKSIEREKICIKSKLWKHEKKYSKILVSFPRFEPGPSSVALQCPNHYNNHAITILLYKLRYINVTSSIQVRFLAGRPWSCIFRNWSRFGSYNVYIYDTRISYTRISYTLLWISSIDNECKYQILL